MMLNPDCIPPLIGIPAAIILWAFALTPVVWAIVHAPFDPNDELSRLDRMDGLGSHVEEVS